MRERNLWLKQLAAAVCALGMACVPAFAQGGAAHGESPLPVQPAAAEPLCTDGMEAELLSALLAAHPDRGYEYTLSLCGQQVSSRQTVLALEGEVTPEMVQELKRWLPCLPALEQVDMYDAALPDEDMAYFHATYPGIRFGWTLSLGKWTVRTDAEAFSTLQSQNSKRYDSTHFEKLRYCYQLKALDLGHNSLTDLSFLEDLPQLRVLILADNKIEDISPLCQLPELQYAELFMNRISDLSPLAGHTRLLDLNLTYNRVSDPSPLLTCTGDTGWFPQLEEYCRGSRYLLAEASLREYEAAERGMYHMTARQAGQLAQNSGAEYLILTHFFPENNLHQQQREAEQSFDGKIYMSGSGKKYILQP